MTSAEATLPDVASLVPHAAPMVLVDRVVSASDEILCAELEIREDSLFCDGNEVGAWVGIEYMAQAVAAHAGYLARLRGEKVKVGFLLGTRNYECWCASFPIGMVLRITVRRLLVTENGIGSYGCEIYYMGTKLAQAVLTLFQPDDVAAYIKKEAAE